MAGIFYSFIHNLYSSCQQQQLTQQWSGVIREKYYVRTVTVTDLSLYYEAALCPLLSLRPHSALNTSLQ